MRYVRFWRGSADDFARITHKNEDTMYFVIQPDTNSFTMYLGATELLSGDDLNSSSIDALEDVIISKKLYDRQVLMYDALQECWVNASLDKAAGAYVGPTAEYMGLPGMLPGAPAGSENLFFRSDGKWVEQHIEKVENIDKLQHTELIANITAQWSEVNKNDLIIIEDILSNNLKNDIAYWYDGKEWLSLANSSIPSDYAENDPSVPSHIFNRPFYKETVTEPLEITWDGVWGGRPYMVFEQNGFGGAVLVKVSDEYFDFEQTEVSSVTILLNNEEQNFPISELHVQTANDESSKIYFGDDILVASFAKDISVGNIEVHKGTYFFKTIGLVGETEEFATGFVSALQFSPITYEKYHKLSNEYADAEWMATESKETATKKFLLNNLLDVFPLSLTKFDILAFHLDSRVYTEKELLGSKLTVSRIADGNDTFSVSFVAVAANSDSDPAPDAAIVRMIGVDSGAEFVLFSSKEEGGLYLIANELPSFPEDTSATIEIFNATDQAVPKKLPNKFLDMDWIPKTETTYEIIYSGEINGDITLPYDPRLFNEDTVLLFTVEDVTYEVRACAGVINGKVELAIYPLILPSGQEWSVICADNSVQVHSNAYGYVIIQIVEKEPKPIPSYFLPEGIGKSIVVKINRPLDRGLTGYTEEIAKAWNSGSTVILEFLDYSISLLTAHQGSEGIYALGIERYGDRLYKFEPLSESGWILTLGGAGVDVRSIPPQIYYRAAGSMEFAPTELNSTLTAGSQLPAQEGAVFTAIQEIKNLITPINEALEAALEGGN